MDPALLQPSSAAASSSDVKPTMPAAGPTSAPLGGSDPTSHEQPHDYDEDDEEGAQLDDGGANEGGGAGSDSKRPRLRLAHACDRCRKRKIRCDTQQPCGPCQATKNECTFHTPSRRTVKPKASGPGERSQSSSGFKRPHSPIRTGLLGMLTGGVGGAGGTNQANLEARLAALEAMLGDVPPKVHNAYLSSLDAQLGSGMGVGIKEGSLEGVGPALEALGGSTFDFSLGGADGGWRSSSQGINGHGLGNGGGGLGKLGHQTLAPDWAGLNGGGGSASGGDVMNWQAQSMDGKVEDGLGLDAVTKRMEGMSFFYEDEIGQAKWQGATSGFPLLDLLTATNSTTPDEADPQSTSPTYTDTFTSPNGLPLSTSPAQSTSALRRFSSHSQSQARPSAASQRKPSTSSIASQHASSGLAGQSQQQQQQQPPSPNSRKRPMSRFFPDRTPRPHQTLNPEASWKVITGVIPPDLMDTLVRCYLSTSHLLWPFLHVPSFLQDYANPAQWGEPGFACFIVAVCTLSSRHVDDPRVRASANDPSTAGKQYFELFKRLRDLPSADRPTLYSIQAAFLAAVYAFGLGNLSKAFALQAESVTLCLDGGLHRSVDGYDHFDAVEKETRKRTFWSIYSWDKQSAALFGRPPIIHLRDCDVTEPLIVDDESLTPEGVKEGSNETTSRICAFVAAIRLHVILEGVIDSATHPSSFPTSPFLARAAATVARRSTQSESLESSEALLEEWTRILPRYWRYDSETANSRDPIRITQAERLHCLEHLVKMIIYRHRFSGFVATPASTAEERARHMDYCRKAMQCALTIVADHVHISQRGMMTYYGVHVIHQLAQAGRTLVAVVLNCRNADFRPLVAPSIEGLRSCVGLLRRFSGRYLCGLRSADIIDEFCRICNIPVDSPRVPDGTGRPSPAWLRPVRRRPSHSPSARNRSSASPSATTGLDPAQSAPSTSNSFPRSGLSQQTPPQQQHLQNELDALFNTSEYFDLSAMDSSAATPAPPVSSSSSLGGTLTNGSHNDFAYTGFSQDFGGQGQGAMGMGAFDYGNGGSGLAGGLAGMGSFGGEMLAGEGMDTVSDGLKGGEAGQGLSAATILSLLEEGSFDYGSVFTDQAPVRMDVEGGGGSSS